MSTHCLLLLIKILIRQFCGGVDSLKLINKYILSGNLGQPRSGDSQRRRNTPISVKRLHSLLSTCAPFDLATYAHSVNLCQADQLTHTLSTCGRLINLRALCQLLDWQLKRTMSTCDLATYARSVNLWQADREPAVAPAGV